MGRGGIVRYIGGRGMEYGDGFFRLLRIRRGGSGMERETFRGASGREERGDTKVRTIPRASGEEGVGSLVIVRILNLLPR